MKNLLIDALAEPQREALRAHLQEVTLSRRQILMEAHESISRLYFPLDCVVSLLALTADGQTVEVGMIGNEGLVGASALLGRITVPYRAMVQIPGKAMSVEMQAVQRIFLENEEVRRRLLIFMHLLVTIIAQSVVCNTFHPVQQRLARWLLKSYERSRHKVLPYTHEFLSEILGTRRVTITLALGEMERQGIIQARRGYVTIVNSKKLEELSCECYFIVQQEQDAVFPPATRNG